MERRTRQATIRDVARLAGVAPGTVSHVLTGARDVRPATRLRVESAIEELGFRRNRVAGSLSSGRTATVAVVVPDIANPYFAELIRGVADRLGPNGFEVVVGSSDDNAEKESILVERLLERRPDAFLIAVARPPVIEHLQRIERMAPVVLVDRRIPEWTGDGAWGADEFGATLAVRHLVELGHRRIGYVAGDQETSTGRDRKAGFLGAMNALGIEPVFVSQGMFTAESGRQRVGPLLSDHRPTAIATANDLLAFGVLAAAHDLGLTVPHDLSVIGYDGVAFGEYSAPALTTIANPPQHLGSIAASIVLDRLAHPDDPVEQRLINPDLVRRSSTGCPTQ
jgi:LacI family transcriptional regulator